MTTYAHAYSAHDHRALGRLAVFTLLGVLLMAFLISRQVERTEIGAASVRSQATDSCRTDQANSRDLNLAIDKVEEAYRTSPLPPAQVADRIAVLERAKSFVPVCSSF